MSKLKAKGGNQGGNFEDQGINQGINQGYNLESKGCNQACNQNRGVVTKNMQKGCNLSLESVNQSVNQNEEVLTKIPVESVNQLGKDFGCAKDEIYISIRSAMQIMGVSKDLLKRSMKLILKKRNIHQFWWLDGARQSDGLGQFPLVINL